MRLQFEVFDAESGAFFYPDAANDTLLAQFDGILGAREAGQLGDKPYLAALDRLLAEAPDFIDAHVEIAAHWYDNGKPKKALDAALAGLRAANRHIPEGYHGRIEWGHLENRPYLRAMDLVLHSYMRLRRHKDAVAIIEAMLSRNPNDNQGVRYLLGSEVLRAGDSDHALRVLQADADGFPPCLYELALCHVQRKEWVAAATALRRGFAANAYIAEILGGCNHPAPLAIWHGSDMDSPDCAAEYLDTYGVLWTTHPEGLLLTRWLFNHPAVLAERAAVMECKESLLWEMDFASRGKIIAKQNKIVSGIDDRLSAAIVTQRKDQRGQMIWPWQALS